MTTATHGSFDFNDSTQAKLNDIATRILEEIERHNALNARLAAFVELLAAHRMSHGDFDQCGKEKYAQLWRALLGIDDPSNKLGSEAPRLQDVMHSFASEVTAADTPLFWFVRDVNAYNNTHKGSYRTVENGVAELSLSLCARKGTRTRGEYDYTYTLSIASEREARFHMSKRRDPYDSYTFSEDNYISNTEALGAALGTLLRESVEKWLDRGGEIENLPGATDVFSRQGFAEERAKKERQAEFSALGRARQFWRTVTFRRP